MMVPPKSRMDVLTETEVQNLVMSSKLVGKYNQVIDNVSAHEMLTQKIAAAEQRSQEIVQMEKQAKQNDQTSKRQPKEEGFFDNPIVRSAGRTAATMITRSLLGVLGLGGSTRRRRKSLF
jgi:hypothetical protein